jgi:hypothetical protein
MDRYDRPPPPRIPAQDFARYAAGMSVAAIDTTNICNRRVGGTLAAIDSAKYAAGEWQTVDWR